MSKTKKFLLPTEISLGGQSHCNTSPAQSLNACQLSSMLISIVSLLSAIQLSIQCVPRPDPSGLSWENRRDGWIFYGRLQETLEKKLALYQSEENFSEMMYSLKPRKRSEHSSAALMNLIPKSENKQTLIFDALCTFNWA